MELTGGQTLSVSKGTTVASTEANIPQDKQVNTVLHQQPSIADEFFSESIFMGGIGSLAGFVGIWIIDAVNSPIAPLFVLVASTASFYFGGVKLCLSLGKMEYLENTMDTLGIKGKKRRKAFARAIQKLPKDEAVTFVSDPDDAGNVSIWKLENKQLSLMGIRNSGDDWDHTLDNITDVYSLQKEQVAVYPC